MTEERFNAINSEAEELKAENRRLEREINKLKQRASGRGGGIRRRRTRSRAVGRTPQSGTARQRGYVF